MSARSYTRRQLMAEHSGYKKLNWISNEGSDYTTTDFPYLNLGFKVTPNTKIVIDYYHAVNNSQSDMFFGQWGSNGINIQTRYSGDVGTWIAKSNTIYGIIRVGNPRYHRHYLTFAKDGASDIVDGSTTYTAEYDLGNNFSTSNNVYLFWASGYHAWLGNRWRVYSFQRYENDVLVMDLIPVQDRMTGINGMYDRISKAFLKSPRKNFKAG